MTSSVVQLIALDVGGKRIGVARGDSGVKIAYPFATISVDGKELSAIEQLIHDIKPHTIIVGYPRNQAGQVTEQTRITEQFSERLKALGVEIVMQDESLTSVLAEERLARHTQKNVRQMVDAEAATIILQDYIERYYGR